MDLEHVLWLLEHGIEDYQNHVNRAVHQQDMPRATLALGGKEALDDFRNNLDYEEKRLWRLQQASSPKR